MKYKETVGPGGGYIEKEETLMGSLLKAEEKQGNTVDTKGKKRCCSEHTHFQTHNNALAF